jgi:ADP-ribose pyrophosphatase YjhB (NUDIX family)
MRSEALPRVLITAGGTREAIDDVRFVSNFSRGRFGATIASALARRGFDVTLLAGVELMRQPEWVDPRVERIGFAGFADLSAAIDAYLDERGAPEMIWMAAAVSDYSPVPTEGKIRSTQDELVVRMRRNPKLLGTLRERCGSATFIVGFKLLSDVEEAELVDVALAQIEKCRLNLCVANDLARLRGAEHPVQVVTPEGGAWPISGSKPEVAERIVDVALTRHRTRWARTVAGDDVAPVGAPGCARAARLLALAQGAGLFPDDSGNVSHRASTPGLDLWVTPRQVAKAEVEPEDLRAVSVDLEAREVTYRLQPGARDREAKSSIDSVVQGWLYANLPWLHGLLHVHDVLALPTARTEAAYPCGTIEEAEEVYRALAAASLRGGYAGGPFALRLVRHGWLFGLEEGGEARLEAEWEAARGAWIEHMGEIGQRGRVGEARLRPVFDGASIVGSLADFGDAVSLYLPEPSRGEGRGGRFVAALSELGRDVVAADLCQVREYYTARGWRVVERADGLARLRPPTRRGDLRAAASVCLVDPVRRRVLLGRRRTPPWQGYWSFPGGGQEGDESLEQAAARELYEECGVRVPPGPLLARTVVHVSSGDGDRAYSVTNFAYAVLHEPEPTPSDELEGVWMTLEQARATRPMAAGTRRVLENVLRALGEA